jgi:hypothetical protein
MVKATVMNDATTANPGEFPGCPRPSGAMAGPARFFWLLEPGR